MVCGYPIDKKRPKAVVHAECVSDMLLYEPPAEMKAPARLADALTDESTLLDEGEFWKRLKRKR